MQLLWRQVVRVIFVVERTSIPQVAPVLAMRGWWLLLLMMATVLLLLEGLEATSCQARLAACSIVTIQHGAWYLSLCST
jgi:hypothetical protein